MKLSIITINYNNRTGLERTLQSVENQNTRDFEHVIIDGASTDGAQKTFGNMRKTSLMSSG